MPRHTLTMHDVGDRVKIKSTGATGTVVAHAHVSSAVQDVVHHVQLDAPVKTTVHKTTDLGGGRTVTDSEEVTLAKAEVPLSDLEEI